MDRVTKWSLIALLVVSEFALTSNTAYAHAPFANGGCPEDHPYLLRLERQVRQRQLSVSFCLEADTDGVIVVPRTTYQIIVEAFGTNAFVFPPYVYTGSTAIYQVTLSSETSSTIFFVALGSRP